MAVALTQDSIATLDPASPKRKRWTRGELQQVENLGVFRPGRYELVEGELIDRMGKNRPHSRMQNRLLVYLVAAFGPERLDPEPSIDVAAADNPINEPIPDFAVYRRPSADIRDSVKPSDIVLLVEISDSSLGFDLRTKAPLYARAGIPEYWVVDINGRRVVVHREPTASEYRSVVSYSESESIAPLAAPGHVFEIGPAFA